MIVLICIIYIICVQKFQQVLVKTKKECIFAPAIKQHAAVA